MYIYQAITIAFLGANLALGSAKAEDLLECPNPIFECIGPGPGGIPPSDPPDPIFKPVYPVTKSGIDFNRNFGVIKDGNVTMTTGSPEISPDLSDYLSRHRDLIDPNAVYLLSPKSVDQDTADSAGLLVGGGALTQ